MDRGQLFYILENLMISFDPLDDFLQSEESQFFFQTFEISSLKYSCYNSQMSSIHLHLAKLNVSFDAY